MLQLTDLHLTPRPGQRLHGWDTWAALDTALEAIAANEPASAPLLLTGDLVHDGNLDAYHLLRQRLDASGRRYYAIPGNHDEPERLYQVFGRQSQLTLGPGWMLQLLDSHLPGSDAGRLGPEQIASFEQRLAATRQAGLNTVVAVHHPPVRLGSEWLDAIGLEDGERLVAACARLARNICILCGHAHQAMDRQMGGLRILCTPSTNRQFTVESTDFSADKKSVPGYRKLELREDGRVTSHVIRLTNSASHFQAPDRSN